jgi:hypothetical protein
VTWQKIVLGLVVGFSVSLFIGNKVAVFKLW